MCVGSLFCDVVLSIGVLSGLAFILMKKYTILNGCLCSVSLPHSAVAIGTASTDLAKFSGINRGSTLIALVIT